MAKIDTPSKTGAGLSDVSSAFRTRDAIRKISRDEVLSEYPRPRYATVVSVDQTNRIVELVYPDETATFRIKAGSIMPLAAGAVVRLAGSNGARYIDDVIEGGVSVQGVDTSTGITPWTNVTFGAGWSNIGSGYQECQYRTERDLVRLRGFARKLSAVTSTDAAFTLPIELRPPATLFLPAWTSDGGATVIQAMRAIQIATDGRVTSVTGLAGGANWIVFDHCFSTLAAPV
jgi:hypothetical protein